jgi:hypothetical protein
LEEKNSSNTPYEQNYHSTIFRLTKIVLRTIIEVERLTQSSDKQGLDLIIERLRRFQSDKSNDLKRFRIGKSILQLFFRLGLIDSLVFYEGKYKHRYLYLTKDLGRTFFATFSKAQVRPFRNLFMLRYPFEVQQKSNTIYGMGLPACFI